jgi:hypothetical protein
MAPERDQTASPTRLRDVTPEPSGDDADWTDQVTDMVVKLVDDVRDRTNGPVIKAARFAVYGVILALVGFSVFLMVLIALGRTLSLIPGDEWIPFAVIGAMLCLGGSLLWSRRNPS